ncbi:MAG: CHAT domain-containing protein [Planctomycetes bacterium]|nr:CHAT domain-containing protein [Planctomycetota bacterium]MCB9824187.1 CHAT domain-containing protein [Planctomycetota bacterium]MCB9830239.1 CHAT domain-containing protein [Planctomycetota bacterium]MCB9902124.1 CHAT domain-containing protein [Planctomycetota bacterium]
MNARTPWILLALVLFAVSDRVSAGDESFEEEVDRVADQVHGAFLERGAEGIAAFATKEKLATTDPFRVAERLLLRHANAIRTNPEGDPQALDAAAAYAKATSFRPAARALPELVERWRALERQDLDRLLRLRATWVAQQRAWNAPDYESVIALADASAPDGEAAPWSPTSIDVATLRSKALAETGRALDAARHDLTLVPRCSAIGWVRLAAALLRRAGGTYQRAGKAEEASRLLADALRRFEALDRSGDVAATLLAESRVDQWKGDFDAALGRLSRAREVLEALGDREPLPEVYTGLGNVSRRLGRPDEALAWQQRSLDLSRELGNAEGVIVALTNVGTLLWDQQDFDAAIARYEEALELAATTPGRPAHRNDLLRLNLAGLLSIQGHLDRAVALCREAVANQRQTPSKEQLAYALTRLGLATKLLGNFAEALDVLEEALSIYRAQGNAPKVFETLRGIASILAPAGRLDEALRVGREALEVARALKHDGAIAQATVELASIHLHRQENEEAYEMLQGARELVTATKDPALRQLWVLLSASALSNLGKREEALPLFREALEFARERRHAAQTIAALKNIGTTLEAMGDLEAANDHFAMAEAEAEQIPPLLAEVLVARCRNHFQRTTYAEAVACAARAVELYLGLARGLGAGEAVAVRGNARLAADYGLDAMLLLFETETATTARVAQAFWFAEAGRALALLEQLENGDRLWAGEIPAGLQQAESNARACVRETQGRLQEEAQREKPDSDRVAALRSELEEAYVRLDGAIASVERARRRETRVIDPAPATLDEVTASLPEKTALLSYHLMQGGQTVVFLVEKGKIRMHRLGNTVSVVEPVLRWRRLLKTPGTDDRTAAREVHDRILGSLAEAEALDRFERLVIATDDVLALVPLDALVHGDGEGRRLVETHEVVCVPSASVFAALPKATTGRGLVALGDPVYPEESKTEAPKTLAVRGLENLGRLPATGDEVRAIGAFFADEGTVLVRERATRSMLEDAINAREDRLAVVHIACHGVLDTERPMLSGLALGGGDVLSVADVYRLRVPADLVVLSACETGLGPISDAEGVLGLPRAFFFAGAPRVVVSAWKVSDQDSKDLMLSFYRSMREGGRPAGAALREAKLQQIAAGRNHPYHWAGFTLWGSP